ncbi:hypothetical protein TWF106_009262 [Orbilia oligospora]|uniref:F-box domain-containing protein n=1 Tax=Orbilia oligospora TaxID=2813651 RepID=A0A7C8UFG6_ORBOL|nr:hypothetical protein TWF106_009262 [Orbilia oligospora]
MELNAKGALKSDDPTPITYTKISPTTSPAESTLPIIHTPLTSSESGIENFLEDAIVIKKGKEEEQSIDSESIESLGLETMSLTSGSSRQQTSPKNQESQQQKCKSLFPFPTDVTQSILEMLSPADIQNFALSSKASCITALPMLVRCVTLPLSDDKTGLGKILGVNEKNYIGTAIVDISNPTFWTTNYPGHPTIGKTLHEFENIKHLIIKKSSPYVSDAVLGSALLFVVEQNVLEELTIEFAFSEQIAGVKAFKDRFRQCWLTVHEGAFHSKQRQLTILNIKIINPNLEYDGLNECQEFWVTIMRTVQKLRIDLRDVPVPEYAPDKSLIWTNYLQMVSSCGVNDIEVVFNEDVSRHYTEIGSQFPNIERLKVGFTGHSRSRPSAELSGLGRMRFLRSVDLPWAYDNIVSDSGIVGNIYSKAKERAKEVVRAKTPTESKDEKMKLQVLKQTKAALAIQSLTSIKDVTWRYVSEEDGEEVLLKLSIHWTGKEPRVTEVGFGGEE